MRLRSLGTKAALTGALALGLGLGMVGQATVAGAQASPTTQPTATSSLASRFLDQLAAALGIQRTELDSAMSSAASGTVAAAVAAGTITQAEAERSTSSLRSAGSSSTAPAAAPAMAASPRPGGPRL